MLVPFTCGSLHFFLSFAVRVNYYYIYHNNIHLNQNRVLLNIQIPAHLLPSSSLVELLLHPS